MEPEISALDPADQAVVAGAQAVRVAAEAVDVPDFPPPCEHAFRGELTFPTTVRRKERFVARRAGEVVGYLCLELPLRDNLENAELELVVHPAHRRHGIGRALHAYARSRLRELGRKRYAAYSVETLPGGPEREGAGTHFGHAVGAKPAITEVRRRLDLTTMDEAKLAEVRDAAAAKAAGYRLVHWQNRTPDEYVADAGYLSSRLVSDAPMGDLQWEVPRVDVDRVREREAQIAAGKQRIYATGAVHEATGRLVAVTDLAVDHSSPWHAWQWITLVEPRHRGHRLGALVKTENLRFLREHEPELRIINTWNAAVNDHMISINEAMGFRPVDSWVNWQQEV
ncbi:MAG TPA: GNAT family N-acetyltransferase [Natronosporangium sp.]